MRDANLNVREDELLPIEREYHGPVWVLVWCMAFWIFFGVVGGWMLRTWLAS